MVLPIYVPHLRSAISEKDVADDKVDQPVLSVPHQPRPSLVLHVAPLAVGWVRDQVGKVEDFRNGLKQVDLVTAKEE